MKRLPIKSPSFNYVEKSFKEWLDILGYAEQTVYSMPLYVRGLLHYMEEKGKTQVHDISREVIKEYYHYELKQRPNFMLKSGALSNNYLNKHLQAFYKFTDYLRQSGRKTIPALNIRMEEIKEEKIDTLTEEEIGQLYKACDQYPEPHKRTPLYLYPALALRDKAMLSIYYGCGLRRNEGLHIELNHILWDKQLLYVCKGKNNKERFVPIGKTGMQHLQNYLYEGRPYFIRHTNNPSLKGRLAGASEHFFISERGKPINGQTLLLRLQQLLKRTENIELQNKAVGLHTLRHSIATHLLSNGMKLEKIKDFLGHSSLESTQIYTHLAEQDQ